MDLEPITLDAARYVATFMRDADRGEIFAGRWRTDPNQLAVDCTAIGDFGWVAKKNGTPIAVVGAVPVHPGVWSVFMFATDDFRQISISLTKFVKRVMIPALVQSGAHRAECKSMEGHEEAHRWLELLGAEREATHPEYGRNRETFHTYVWRRHNVHGGLPAEG
jgi:RimJ/RimL family protein N-acetyltransferase